MRSCLKEHLGQAAEWYNTQFSQPCEEALGSLRRGLGEHSEDWDLAECYESESDEQSNGDLDPGRLLFNLATRIYEGASEALFPTSGYNEVTDSFLISPWSPLQSAEEFKLSRWFLQSGVSQEQIDDYFRSPSVPKGSYTTGRGFTCCLDEMSSRNGLRTESWVHSGVEIGSQVVPYCYRDPMAIVRFLLRQRAFRESLVYAPTMEYNEMGERMYGEMQTVDWWWEMQGSTVIPVICASDGTHLTNFSRDKKAWPVYLTSENIRSETRNKPSNYAIVLLAVLRVPPKLGVGTRADEQHWQSQMALHKVLGDILDSLQSLRQSGELIQCADGFEGLCYPILCAWIMDHPEHAALLNINNDACPRCEVDFKGLGGLQQSAPRIQQRYMEMAKRYKMDTSNKIPVEYLVSKCSKTIYIAFWALPRVNVYDLHKPDILNNLYLRLLKHMMGWVQLFLKKHK
ncbi:uncharacterized protein H6S33_001895 [Morchella sextelata]|uniref:uncharacterized protein n=1 Tax=Morchella sextelata TaxID=1174677 RepID=UPI001D039257|nr:uncharacterized protein H6S33_001895 [Morchella sextelata]KAH0608761.1 hypothetical protein H6S33_001895 [Morchella sextelata]